MKCDTCNLENLWGEKEELHADKWCKLLAKIRFLQAGFR